MKQNVGMIRLEQTEQRRSVVKALSSRVVVLAFFLVIVA